MLTVINQSDDVALTSAAGKKREKEATWQTSLRRIGYPNTRSLYVFYNLDQLTAGDRITLKDSDGGEYDYQVTEQKVVSPDNVQVMNAVPGKCLVTLQTCTLPDFTERVVVQGELVEQGKR